MGIADATPDTGFWPSHCSGGCFRQIIEGLPVALVLIRPDGRIGFTSRRVERMFGYDRGSLQDKAFKDLLPSRLHSRIDLSAAGLSSLVLPEQSKAMDLSGMRRDGSEFPLEIEFHLLDIDGEPTVVTSLADMTASIEHARERLQQQRELDRSHADRDEFVYAASHDLKAPLRAISHLTQWIGEDIEATVGSDTKENLELLRGRVARLQLLLDGLLNYSRISTGPLFPVEPIDIAEMVRDVTASLAPPPGFVVACDGEIPIIHTHRTAIRTVLDNLIGNGIKHHDRSEGRLTISLQLKEGIAEFRVSDDGAGIPPQYHDKVFKIFQTLAARDDVEASGVGLTIVRRRVQDHGGAVWIESAPPKRGTTFVFTWHERPQ